MFWLKTRRIWIFLPSLDSGKTFKTKHVMVEDRGYAYGYSYRPWAVVRLSKHMSWLKTQRGAGMDILAVPGQWSNRQHTLLKKTRNQGAQRDCVSSYRAWTVVKILKTRHAVVGIRHVIKGRRQTVFAVLNNVVSYFSFQHSGR